MDDLESQPGIVIDNGSGYCKAGFSGEEDPRSVFPNCIAPPKYSTDISGNYKDELIGTDAKR